MPPAIGRRRYPPDEVGDHLIAIYATASNRLTNLAAAAIERNALGTARYYEQQKAVLGKEISRLRIDSARARGQLIRTAYLTGLSAIDRVLKKEEAFTGIHDAAMEVLAANLAERLKSAEDRIGREVNDVFRQAALQHVAIGAAAGLTPEQRSRALAADLRARGITAFTDRKGRRWNLDSYASMVTRTTTREAMSAGMANRLRDHGRHLVKISEHRTSCDICGLYEGNTYTLTEEGEPEYERLVNLPPFHPNCRHVLTPATVSFEEMEKALGLGPAQEPEPGEAGTEAPSDEEGPELAPLDPLQAEIEEIRKGVGDVPSPSHEKLIGAGRKLDRIIEREIPAREQGIAAEADAEVARRAQLLHARTDRREAIEEGWRAGRGELSIADADELIRLLAEDPELKRLKDEAGRSMTRTIELEKKREGIRREVTIEILSRLRGFGGKIDVRSKRGKIFPMLGEAEACFPSEWIERANGKAPDEGDALLKMIAGGQMPKLALLATKARAFYNDGKREVHVRQGDRSTLLHELGHYFEYHGTEEGVTGQRGIERVLRSWYAERTAGETLKWLGGAYGRDEKGREDRFANVYIGKDYGDGSPAMEVFTMGLEGVFYDRHRIRERDPDHAHLILGILGFVR